MGQPSWANDHGLVQQSPFITLSSDLMTSPSTGDFWESTKNASKGPKNPDFLQLNILVLAAVLEVVCVSLPGYLVARQGMFDAEAQKFLANLNVMLFTPALIFTKLASQLTPDKLGELAIIPVIFALQTLVSYVCSRLVARAFRFKKRAANFVTAMGVFGNSNSLPISLILSLSKTLPGLHWDKIPDDNDNEVGARGILYLLIFQQLGQLLRWSWGYHVLLAPPGKFTIEEGGTAAAQAEEGIVEEPVEPTERHGLLINVSDTDEEESASSSDGSASPRPAPRHSQTWSGLDSGSLTPLNRKNYSHSSATLDELHTRFPKNIKPLTPAVLVNGAAGAYAQSPVSDSEDEDAPISWKSPKSIRRGTGRYIVRKSSAVGTGIKNVSKRVFQSLPLRLQSGLSKLGAFLVRFSRGLMEFMNPPLWAMLAAIVVCSIPRLQHVFFSRGHFINTSVTRAIEQSGGVAVPLILVVLGANLARNTIPQSQIRDSDPILERKLVFASLICRMLLPTLIMAPVLALVAKYAPVSIVDDPVFVVVCFLLTGAPSALQLAQICQLNDVYVGAMTKLLFQSYVVWILPSTLALVVMAVKVVQWAV